MLEAIERILDILEARKHTDSPEAPKYAPLGRWAWSSSREGIPKEPDNANERFLKRELAGHFLTKHRSISKPAADMILRIRRNGWYEPVFHEPPDRVLFRGLRLKDAAALAKLLKLPEAEVSARGSLRGKFIVAIKGEHSTAWSAKKRVAFEFAREEKKGWAVVLTAEVKPNRLRFQTGPGGLYDVEGVSYYHLERETMGIEPITVSRIEWKFLG
jgi:hypothetical protein